MSRVVIPEITEDIRNTHIGILRGLGERLNELLKGGEAFWNGTMTINGGTQVAGKKFEALIDTCLTEMGYTFERAGSQQPYDFRDVGGSGLQFDIKKTDGNRIMLNDTIPKRGTWQVIFATKQKKVIIVPTEFWLDVPARCEGIQE